MRDITSDRRLAILAACVVEWAAAIADTVVETHDRIVGSIWREAKWVCDARVTTAQSEIAATLAGFDPEMPGLAPVAAIKQTLSSLSLRSNDLKVAEIMEAFAVQAIACVRGAGLDPSIVNAWGGNELVSNRRDDHEISVLSLHLLQAAMVYVNTLMIQEVLRERAWREKMTDRDMAALNPLPHSHFNPYGVFDLDMDTRLPFEEMRMAA